jgi:hypothetical protein
MKQHTSSTELKRIHSNQWTLASSTTFSAVLETIFAKTLTQRREKFSSLNETQLQRQASVQSSLEE